MGVAAEEGSVDIMSFFFLDGGCGGQLVCEIGMRR
jgi:hypothetical protein